METQKQLRQAYMEATGEKPNYVGTVVRLTNGGLLNIIGRVSLETDFCFGWSSFGQGPTIEEAREAADDCRHNKREFFQYNLRDIDRLWDQWDSDEDEHFKLFCSQRNIEQGVNVWQLFNDDGSWYKYEGEYLAIFTDDMKAISDAFETERARLLARLESYWKKYGGTKLHIWTFCCDD